MGLMVVVVDGSHRLAGDGAVVESGEPVAGPSGGSRVLAEDGAGVRVRCVELRPLPRSQPGSSCARSWRRTCSTGWRGSANRCPAPGGGSCGCSSDVARHRRR